MSFESATAQQLSPRNRNRNHPHKKQTQHNSCTLLLLVLLLHLLHHQPTTAMASPSKVCAVFGFGPKVGASVARKWSSEGYKVAIMSRKLEKLVAASKDIPNSKGFACDVTVPENIDETIASIEADLGPIDVLVWNAGNGVWKVRFFWWLLLYLFVCSQFRSCSLFVCAACNIEKDRSLLWSIKDSRASCLVSCHTITYSQCLFPFIHRQIHKTQTQHIQHKTWDKIELEDFDAAMKTNVYGLLRATQNVAPGMIERAKDAPPTSTPSSILVTGATASLRGKPITVGFAPQKGAQRLLSQALARDLGPKGVHVGLFIIDGLIGDSGCGLTDPTKLDPDAIAATYWSVANQCKTAWSFETEVRPSMENW